MRLRPIQAIPRLGWQAWLATLAGFALLCAIVAYWILLLAAPHAPIAPPARSADGQSLPELKLASQLFGARTSAGPSAAQPSNILVLGVLAAGARGSAVLSIDSKPAKAYGVGDRLSATQSLVAVRGESITVDAGGLRSDLPAPPKPDVSLLTSGAGRDRAAGSATGTAAATVAGNAVSANPAGGQAVVGLPPRMPPPPPPNDAQAAPEAAHAVPGSPPGGPLLMPSSVTSPAR